MRLSGEGAEIWVPDGVREEDALKRVTHVGISAHQDDIEIMAMQGILAGFGRRDRWFMGIVVTNGAGSPRDGLYADYTDEQMQVVRRLEQKKAAFVGEYSAVAFLNHTSSAVKSPSNPQPKDDLKALIAATQPEVVYTHNLADKHDTHVSVALRTIAAIRELPASQRPHKLYGCEVWRDLDWLTDSDKTVFDVSQHEHLQASLVGVFDSQIAGGKRYDLATMARRRAHATYYETHAVDAAQLINFGIDLTPLVEDEKLDLVEYIDGFIGRFAEEVAARLRKLS
ncbi:MAG TPA: PIG-L family deacetylase [Candidatus Binatia bacterium]|nr:PIG-L family deacetylase [Candidatus Binatia bacterium]